MTDHVNIRVKPHDYLNVADELNRTANELRRVRRECEALSNSAPFPYCTMRSWTIASTGDEFNISIEISVPPKHADVVTSMFREQASRAHLPSTHHYIVALEEVKEAYRAETESALVRMQEHEAANAYYRGVLERVKAILENSVSNEYLNLERVANAINHVQVSITKALLSTPKGCELLERVERMQTALEEKRTDVAADLIVQLDEENPHPWTPIKRK